MSNEILYRHELHVVFEEDEDHVVSWTVLPDQTIQHIADFDNAELAAEGAPLAAIGIKVLNELLGDNVIELALNKADNCRWRNLFAQIQAAQDDWEEPDAREAPTLHLVN